MCVTRSWFPALALAIGLLFSATHATAQNLPADIVQSAAALNEAQLRTVDAFITPAVQQLATSADDAQVAAARRKLVEPFGMGGTDLFKNEYTRRLSARLNTAGALATEARPAVRLNAMIVVSYMTDPSALPLVEQGLQDPSPAVRFWAARAVQNLGDKALSNTDRERLLDLVSRTLKNEQGQEVVEELLRTYSRINIPRAAQQLMVVLNERVTRHAAHPDTSMAAEQAALQEQFRNLVQAKALNNQAPPALVVKELAKAALRYGTIAVDRLRQNPNMSSVNRDSLTRFIELADNALRWSVNELAPNRASSVPADFKLELQQGQWEVVKLRFLDWNAFLQKDDAFKFNAAELSLAS